MQLRIAATFTDALARLPAQEQKAVKTTAFDLQMDASAPGLSFHRIEASRDPNFWSVRVNRDIRIIVHKTPAGLLLAYVDHHDKAYAWAERQRIEAHPTTGAAQIVEVRERVEVAPAALRPSSAVAAAVLHKAPPLFAGLREEDLLAVGVPQDWLDDVREASQQQERWSKLASEPPCGDDEREVRSRGASGAPDEESSSRVGPGNATGVGRLKRAGKAYGSGRLSRPTGAVLRSQGESLVPLRQPVLTLRA